jgi:hypothetical protein
MRQALCPRNAALKVNVEVAGHQQKTISGHRRDGLGGLPAALPEPGQAGTVAPPGTSVSVPIGKAGGKCLG